MEDIVEKHTQLREMLIEQIDLENHEDREEKILSMVDTLAITTLFIQNSCLTHDLNKFMKAFAEKSGINVKITPLQTIL